MFDGHSVWTLLHSEDNLLMTCIEMYLRAGVESLLRGVDPVAMKEAGRGRALRDGI